MLKVAIIASALVALCHSVIVLKPLDYLRLPGKNNAYGINLNSAKESAFDELQKILYVVGKDTELLHVIDVFYPDNTVVLGSFAFEAATDGNPLDVEVCRGGGFNIMAISFDSQISSTNDGHVVLYNLFDRTNGETLTKVNPQDPNILVGPHPDNIKFTSDCGKLIVANEGEPRVNAGQFVDPSGSLTIITVPADLTNSPSTAVANFDAYNPSAAVDALLAKGVRFWMRRDPIDNSVFTSFSQNTEPEYVAISPNNGFAYVTLQENNAIAKVNLESNMVVDIVAMGNKSFEFNNIDANDQNGVVLKTRRVVSLYQPDKVTFLQWNGVDYLLTADEGRPSSIPSTTFTDHGRASALGDWNVDASLEGNLTSNSELGRAYMSRIDGLNGGQRVVPVMFGGRGFSILNANTFARVYDSADELERQSAIHYPQTFNGDCCIASQTPNQQSDTRSTWMGPEISAIAVGTFNDQTVIVAGSGRNGVLYVFRILPGANPSPDFQSVYRAGAIDGTWQQLYDRVEMGDAKISDIKFTSVPNPLFMVTSEASSSVAFYGLADEQWP